MLAFASIASVNPARSLGVAWFAGNGALIQVWVFLVIAVIGGIIAGLVYSPITGTHCQDRDITGHCATIDLLGES